MAQQSDIVPLTGEPSSGWDRHPGHHRRLHDSVLSHEKVLTDLLTAAPAGGWVVDPSDSDYLIPG